MHRVTFVLYKSILLSFIMLAVSGTRAQTKVYEMSVLGFKFGKMTVTRTIHSDSSEVYSLHASGKATVLWMDFISQTRQESVYKHGKLVSSFYQEIENGKVKRWTKVLFDGNHYQVDSYKGKRSFTEAPLFSIASLYFNGFQTLQNIFYEAEAEFTKVRHNGKDRMEILTSEGNRSIYHFVNGEIENMEFYISIAVVYMKRIA